MATMQGKVVAITGASRGIGESTARIFAQAGAKVVLLARSRDLIGALANEIGGDALALACDVSDFGQVKAVVADITQKFSRLDVLVNNAGAIQPISHIATSDPQEWGQAIDVNLKGSYHCIRAVLPGMLAQGGGSILNVSSGAANAPMEGWSAYCSSKAGAAMLTRATAAFALSVCRRGLWQPRCSATSKPPVSIRSAKKTGQTISRRNGQPGRCSGCAARMPTNSWARMSNWATKISAGGLA